MEDAADIREALREILECEGIPVYTAENGAVGLARLKAIPTPCLVLLDLMMPVLDGFGFLAALEDLPSLAAVPVVLISANRNMETAERHPRVVRGLRKPFELDELLGLVQTHCH